jgi:hypothetical protein
MPLFSTLEKLSMKKTLIALAAVAATGAAFAQSSVTLSGNYGIGITSTGTAVTKIGQTDGSLTYSVVEDLGGGMKVAATQTLAIGTHASNATGDGGSLTVSGGFGSFKYGNTCAGRALGEAVVGGDYHFAHALGKGAGDCRADYQYALYTAPTFVPGLTIAARIQNMATGGAISAEDFSATANGAQIRLTYAAGPMSASYFVRSNSGEVHASYNLGVATVKFGADTKTSTGKNKRTEFGLAAPMGPVTLSFGYGKQADTKISGLQGGVSYALSKRTAIDAVYGSFKNTNVDKSYRVRLLHSF